MIPAIFVLFYLPYSVGGSGRLRRIRAGRHHRQPGRLLRAQTRAQTSRLGAFLDPVADKLIVATALVLIVSRGPERWFVVIVAIVIIGREIAVSALREWMAEIGARGKHQGVDLGKYKTIMQIVGLSFLLFRPILFGIPVYQLGLVLTAIAAVLTLWSMIFVPAAGVAGVARQLRALIARSRNRAGTPKRGKCGSFQ